MTCQKLSLSPESHTHLDPLHERQTQKVCAVSRDLAGWVDRWPLTYGQGIVTGHMPAPNPVHLSLPLPESWLSTWFKGISLGIQLRLHIHSISW